MPFVPATWTMFRQSRSCGWGGVRMGIGRGGRRGDADFIAKAVEGVEGVFIVRWTWYHTSGSSFIQGLE